MMPEFIEKIFGAIRQGYQVLSRFGPRPLRALLVLSIILFAASLYFYFYEYSPFQRGFERLLASPSLPVAGAEDDQPKRFPALEAVITADFDSLIFSNREGPRLTDTLKLKISALRTALKNDDTTALYDLKLQYSEKTGDEKNLLNFFITDNSTKSVLFLPIFALKSMPSHSPTNEEILKHLSTHHPVIVEELMMAKRIEQILAEINGGVDLPEPLGNYFDRRPVNTYVVFQAGVTRMAAKGSESEYYLSQFDPKTFFPSRPYFWPAVEKYRRLPVNSDCPSFSGSYFDLAGKGLVFTMAQAFTTSDSRYCCICLDFGLSELGRQKIEELLGGFDATLRKMTIQAGGTLEADRDLELSANERSILAGFGDVKRGEYLSGGIRNISANSDSILFSIPIRGQENGEQQLFVGRMNLRRLKYIEALLRWAPIIFGAFTLLISYLMFSLLQRSRDYQEQIAQSYDKILSIDAFDPTYAVLSEKEKIEKWPAYCRLDHQDRIITCSNSFLELFDRSIDKLGGPDKAREQLAAYKFATLLFDNESRQTYDRIQRQRREGKDLNPTGHFPWYEVKLRWPKCSKWILVRVFSAHIPEPENSSVGLPETFGLVFVKNSGDVTLE